MSAKRSEHGSDALITHRQANKDSECEAKRARCLQKNNSIITGPLIACQEYITVHEQHAITAESLNTAAQENQGRNGKYRNPKHSAALTNKHSAAACARFASTVLL